MQLTVNSILRVCVPRRVRKFAFSRSSPKHRTLSLGRIFRHSKRRLYERILQYPKVSTRLIQYPAINSKTEPDSDPRNTLEGSFYQTPSHKTKDLPSSPEALLELLKSEKFKQAQEDQRRRIQGSYEILESNPWKVSVPLYVLTVEDPGSQSSQVYTLRTRLEEKLTSENLKRVFRGDSFKGEFIKVDKMTDGVISFIDYDDAERFRSLLEAEVVHGVSICQVTSHQLFQVTTQAKALVVLLKCRDYLPSTHELTTSLRAQRSLEPF